MKSTNRPAYNLKEVQTLVSEHKYNMKSRAARFMVEHYGETVTEAVRDVFYSLGEGDYKKTVELEHEPGTYADIYTGGWYDDMSWYVKFYISDGTPKVEIWSLNWDGAVH